MDKIINRIHQGNSLEVLKTFPDECIDMVITSPPYWNLRDYGVEGQLGLETDPEMYVFNLWVIFEEIKRVLKKEGTCWINLGDSYSGNRYGNTNYNEGFNQRWEGSPNKIQKQSEMGKSGIKRKMKMQDKCLIQIPSRFSIKMTDSGWILRNEIIWHKPNAMPSSAKDRFTVDYEKLFMFTKNKKYYFDQQFEELSEASLNDFNARKSFRNKGSNNVYACPGEGRDRREFYNLEKGRNKRCVWSINTKPFKEAHFATYPQELIDTPIKAGCPEGGVILDPFMGSGTTAVVALRNNKNFVGIELNPEYINIAEQRIYKEMGMFS